MPTVVIPPVGAPGSLAGVIAAPLGSQPVPTPVTAGLGASPATFTNATANVQELHVNAGAGATTTITKGGVVIASAITAAATGAHLSCLVGPGQSVIVTFSAALTSAIVDAA